VTVRRTKLTVERYDLGSLRLYREDLQAMATAAAEAGDLTIQCDGFEATSPDDFNSLPEKLANVNITAKRPADSSSLKIRISPKEAIVQLEEPDTLLAGILSRIRLICEPRRRRLRSLLPKDTSRLYALSVALVGSLIAAAAATVGAYQFTSVSPPNSNTSSHSQHHSGGGWTGLDTAGVVIGAIFLLSLVGYVILVAHPKVIIINAIRSERPTYWQRTRDNWLIGIATTILGVVLGYILGKLT
jgi:hypothetical protein